MCFLTSQGTLSAQKYVLEGEINFSDARPSPNTSPLLGCQRAKYFSAIKDPKDFIPNL